MATPVMSGYSDFGQNWKVRKTCCFCLKLIVLMKEQNFECFRRIRRVFQQLKKSTKKMATPVMSGYSDFGQNWKVRKTCCFCFKLIVLMKEQNFGCFRRIRSVFSTFEKLNRKNSTNKMATPVRSGYRDFRQNWKVGKKCCFCFKLTVLMKEQNSEYFRRIRRVFSNFKKLNKKN